MNLSLLILLPLVTAVVILFCKGLKQVRAVALLGSVIQLGASSWLMLLYWHERGIGNNSPMLFESIIPGSNP
jgi:NADH-quinone oxidoreductase subunit M